MFIKLLYLSNWLLLRYFKYQININNIYLVHSISLVISKSNSNCYQIKDYFLYINKYIIFEFVISYKEFVG